MNIYLNYEIFNIDKKTFNSFIITDIFLISSLIIDI